MRKRKPDIAKASFKDWLLPLRLVIILGIISFSLFFLFLQLEGVLKALDYFKVKAVTVLGSQAGGAGDFSYLKGRNIFDIDLEKEAERISGSYPIYKKVRLVRVLPDRLFVDFIKRTPLAYIKLDRLFLVDEDGVLLDAPSAEELPFPVITGLQSKISAASSGRKCKLVELSVALDIIRQACRNKGLKDYLIEKVDVANLSAAALFIGTLEVKLGQENLKEKMNILAGLLSQTKSDQDNIEYIDLRFKEPVIKFKNAPTTK